MQNGVHAMTISAGDQSRLSLLLQIAQVNWTITRASSNVKNMIVDGKQKQTSFQDNVEIDLHLKASSTA